MFCQTWYGGLSILYIYNVCHLYFYVYNVVLNFVILIFVSIRFHEYYSVTTITVAT